MIMLDTSQDAGAYVLGILWGTMAEFEGGYFVRHRDPWYPETVRGALDLLPSIHKVIYKGNPQYRLKIKSQKEVSALQRILTLHGWQPRQASERPYPSGSLNDRGFIRAWVELHGATDIRMAWKRNRSKYPQKRLRIYGNWALLEEMNYILSAATGLPPRTLQPTGNHITKVLHYQGSSVPPVLDWLYDQAEIWNPAARARLELKAQD